MKYPAAAVATVLAAGAADASLVLTVQQTGSGVQIGFDGSLDLFEAPAYQGDLGRVLTLGDIGIDVAFDGREAVFSLDPIDRPYGVSGTLSASSTTGEAFGTAGTGSGAVGKGFFLPAEYREATLLDGVVNLEGATLDALGLFEGMSVIEAFCNFDELVIDVIGGAGVAELPDSAPIPLPGTLPLLLAGIGALALRGQRRT
jgi:hypothetical protein